MKLGVVNVRVQLLVLVGGRVGGSGKKINALLNSVEVKIEVLVEFGNNLSYINGGEGILSICTVDTFF